MIEETSLVVVINTVFIWGLVWDSMMAHGGGSDLLWTMIWWAKAITYNNHAVEALRRKYMITVVGWFGPATNTRGLFLLDLGQACASSVWPLRQKLRRN